MRTPRGRASCRRPTAPNASASRAVAALHGQRWTRCWWRWRRSSRAATCSADRARPRAVDGQPARPRRASCAPASGSRSTSCPPPRAWPSGPQPMALAVCTRTSTCWCSTSPPAWWCTRRRATGRARCSTACWPTTPARRAAARRHRAPAGQGHLGPDGGGQDAAGRDGAGARHRAREVHRATWRWRTAWPAAGGAFASTRRSAATPASRVRMAVVPAGKPARTDVERAGRPTAAARCAARCTPGARTRSACTCAFARPSAGGRCAVRRAPGAGPAAPGAARGAAGLRTRDAARRWPSSAAAGRLRAPPGQPWSLQAGPAWRWRCKPALQCGAPARPLPHERRPTANRRARPPWPGRAPEVSSPAARRSCPKTTCPLHCTPMPRPAEAV
jgi:hypothetical protein